MKLSESRVIKTLNGLATIALVFYVIFLALKIFSSSSPKSSNAIKSYKVYNVSTDPKRYDVDKEDHLKSWFNDTVVVQKTSRALVHLRFRSYSDLFSFSSILFQVSIFVYWLLIGVAIFFAKRLFQSLKRDEVFTKRNATAIMISSLILICLPISRWVSQELFISCINRLHLNDSNYTFSNGESLLASETIIGLVLMAFAWAFKVGVDIKQENDAFV